VTVHHDEDLDEEKYWRKLLDADRRDFTILASSHGQGENENESGVISGHAYSVIAAHETREHGQ
jgi:hypothetical protein